MAAKISCETTWRDFLREICNADEDRRAFEEEIVPLVKRYIGYGASQEPVWEKVAAICGVARKIPSTLISLFYERIASVGSPDFTLYTHPEGDASRLLDDREIRVMTFNILGPPDSIAMLASRLTLRERFPHIVATLRKYPADIICMQEAFAPRMVMPLIRAFSQDYPWIVANVGDRFFTLLNSGLMIFSKWPLKDITFTPYRVTGDHEHLANKGVLRVRIQLTEDRFISIFNTHLASSYVSEARKLREKQFEELNRVIDEERDHTPHALLTLGDLNSRLGRDDPKESEKYRFFEGQGYTYNAPGLIDHCVAHREASIIPRLKKAKSYHSPGSDHAAIRLVLDLGESVAKDSPSEDIADGEGCVIS